MMGDITWFAIRDIIAGLFLISGLFFMFVGGLGIWRMPDAYHRLHAASKCTTLGITGMLLAACFHIADPIVISKAIIAMIFTFVANPIGSHMIAKAAHHGRLKIWSETLRDELAIDKNDPTMSVSDDITGCIDDNPDATRCRVAYPESAREVA